MLGVRDMVPLFLGAVPVALLIGVTVAESAIPDWAGYLSAPLIFGGSAQLAAITLLAAGSPAVSALAAALVVNARHLMYSAALVPRFRHQPRWFRRLGPYVLLDQVFALAVARDDPPAEWRAYYLGAGLFAWVMWQASIGVGILAGPVVTERLDLEFSVPVLFIGLFVPAIRNRRTGWAAVTAAVVTAALAGLPNRAGMLVGALAGVAAGVMVERGGR